MEKIDTDYKRRNLKSLAKLFKPFNRDWAPLSTLYLKSGKNNPEESLVNIYIVRFFWLSAMYVYKHRNDFFNR